jgi:hypothetical protein
MNADEFIKVVVLVTGNKVEKGPGYWAQPYIDRARVMGLIAGGELEEKDYKRPITRGEIARIVVRAMEGEAYPKDINLYKKAIKDYEDIAIAKRDYVVKAYVKGIMTGYPDGTFGYEKKATRAEASAMVVRLIDKSQRRIPAKPSEPVNMSKTYTGIKDGALTEQHIENLKKYPILSEWPEGVNSINFFQDNDTFTKIFGLEKVLECYKKAKGFIYALLNVDYTKMDKAYEDELKKYVNEQDHKSYVGKIVRNAKQYKTISKGNFCSDPSFVYMDRGGSVRVKGTVKYYVSSCTDIEKVYTKGALLNHWVEEDIEVELYSLILGTWDVCDITTLTASPRLPGEE